MTVPIDHIPARYNMSTHFVDRHLLEGRGDKTAIICGASCVTYSQLHASVNQVANGLDALDVKRGERVLILLPDCVEFATAYLGTVKQGAVAVLTNTALHAPDYAYFLNESEARALVVDDALWPEVEPILGDCPNLRDVIVRGKPRERALGWDAWTVRQSSEFEAADTASDDVAFWLWTSGSTGMPKGTPHRHRDWNYCAEFCGRGVLEIGADDITFSSSKLFHAYGLGNALMFPLHVGATTVLYPGRPTPDVILSIVDRQRPTIFYSVPTLYAAMLAATEGDNPYDFGSVRTCVSAAEPLPAPVLSRWEDRFGLPILDGIGSTEVLHMYASTRPGAIKPGSTGHPVAGYEIKITDEAGTEVQTGQVGDLWVRGPSTTTGYWNRDDLNRERWQDGWFLSGDKYYSDDQGFLFYAGRSDDMFKVSGQWVSPTEVESCLIAHERVLESAVVSFENRDRLLKPKAFVVLKAGFVGDSALVDELQRFVRERVATYKYPRRIEFIESLPKTAAGKIQRFKLRQAKP